ncbi:zinc finger protein PLAG1-like [Thrips palmi]|uniref:Zinc finger protein PLAG1-like n=1 Tax=Thrips palmi TaxID=161013 RepID=A0A6P8YTG7_THRPL|nr:zinc finger protein PLAG1-like [Thrips palmi]XP_034243337.1 zinc finger protein PLAG1-like [Thrips palmi]XP_034243338.1 zinc finger protein PLAG1-like [Thrips palmi]
MGTRNSGKKADDMPVSGGPPTRLLRPRGVCFRCHFPSPASCVCPNTTTVEVKVRFPSTLVSPEAAPASVSPTAARKRKPTDNNLGVVQARSKSPPSRRQLFQDDYSNSIEPDLDAAASILSDDQALSEADETYSLTSSSDCESISSQAVDDDTAIPSTSEPLPSTSSAETTSSRPKRKRRKLKTVGRHVCPICSKTFGSPGKLSQHMFSHTGEKPFECDKCMKAFSSKFKLVRHLLIHSDERQYCCPMCDRTFHRKDHLKNHLKVHSPVKKTYRCDKVGCLKVYSSFLSYRKHAAVHAAEEGDLECKMCGKTFPTKDEIVYHLKVHAGSRTVKNPSDKKYGCDYCDRRFFTRKDVRRHLVVHTGKRDFLCQFCPHRFGRKDHLVRHIKKSHCNVSLGVRIAASKGKRPRPVTSSGSSQANVSTPGLSTVRQKTVLRTHGRPKAASAPESLNATNTLVYEEHTNEFESGVLSSLASDIKSTKQELCDSPLKVEDIMMSQDDDSFQVKVEECSILPDLQPLVFTHPPSASYVELAVDDLNVPTDQVDGDIKSEQPLSSLSVGMDMNQFISGYLASSSSTSEPDSIQPDQPVSEQSVSTQPTTSTGMSDVEATEFLAQFSNDDEIMQFMELSIPITTAATSASTSDLNSTTAPLGPLPRFQQAFQQQPP